MRNTIPFHRSRISQARFWRAHVYFFRARCKIGDIKEGIEYFEEAVAIGTADVYMLSAIYSQLGNAYFYVGDYKHALLYHRLDLNLNQKVGNFLAEAKASGNIGSKGSVGSLGCANYL